MVTSHTLRHIMYSFCCVSILLWGSHAAASTKHLSTPHEILTSEIQQGEATHNKKSDSKRRTGTKRVSETVQKLNTILTSLADLQQQTTHIEQKLDEILPMHKQIKKAND